MEVGLYTQNVILVGESYDCMQRSRQHIVVAVKKKYIIYNDKHINDGIVQLAVDGEDRTAMETGIAGITLDRNE